MKSTDIFDAYLRGELQGQQKADFEKQLRDNAVFAAAFDEHRALLATLNSYHDRKEFKKRLQTIHEKQFGTISRILSLNENNFARRHGRTIAVAASTALFAVLSTVAILSAGGYLFKQQSNQITDLNRVVRELKASNDGIIASLTSGPKKPVYAPANLEGTAFALDNRGFLITSFHMVSGSDSIFVRNAQTDRAMASVVYCDPRLDLAVLKITDQELLRHWQIPYTLKETGTDIGDKVFTLGYPRRDMVYGEGSLSSLSGYFNDTAMFQISIPVNPGNSGGPLLDENGCVIGVIRGKIAGAEGTGFAIKSGQILASIKEASADSLLAHIGSQNPKKSPLKNLRRSEQIKRINPYVFNVLVYKKDL